MTSKILTGDVRNLLSTLDSRSVQCVVTSPPYWGLRDYGVKKQMGWEKTPEEYVVGMVSVFREVRRVLRDDGTLWLNIGDSYAGPGKGRNADGHHQEGGKQGTSRGTVEGKLPKFSTGAAKAKDLMGIPWMLAFALRADGWYLRQDIIWHKPNPMPESVTDRCTKAHEHLFLLTKSPRYFFDADAIKEPCSAANVRDFKARKTLDNKGKGAGTFEEARKDLSRSRDAYMPKDFMRNKRDVWSITTKSFRGAHFAVMPEALVEPCILAGTGEGSTVLDPFCGSGTVGVVAKRHGCSFIGIELNPKYSAMARRRIKNSH